LDEEEAFVFIHSLEGRNTGGAGVDEEGVVADIVDMSGFGVETKQQDSPFLVHGVTVAALIHGAEVMYAGIDREAEVAVVVGRAKPVAVEADVHLMNRGRRRGPCRAVAALGRQWRGSA
jgi:hypothetical protein